MLLRISAFILLTIALLSCRDDFSLEGDYQDIPVAYGFLNADDDRHFIRVEKAFLESGGNANANAGIADSIYYGDNEATVILQNKTTLEDIELERVNAEQFGLDREDGVFAESPNILYTFRDSELRLSAGNEVMLSIQRPGQEDAVAETVLLREIEINRPAETVRVDDYRRPLVMSWTKGDNARVYDVRIIFNIRELFPSDASRNRDISLEWVLSNAYVPSGDQESGNLVRFEVDPEGFYSFLGANLERDDDIVRRFVDFDVRISAAGQEVLDRRNLENANSGITSSQSLPRYTNLSGGIGMVTSNTTTLKTGVDFDNNSRDSLVNGSYTRDLGFL
ncbi:DUF4249 family protein [Neolewinella agarilytica]|uniref:DUF4249 family protein n=1 Tax=Neolewinella agarilytica TaxID=478744 RepID=A0A1H9MQS6_9BACT|nr:DUF4249 family protein [Neolewinella agarilytica]SER26074.1 protein of unknown function [Neolewinella agarilytica]